MNSAVILFGARVLLLVLLYLFLLAVVRALRGDLRAAARRTPVARGAPAPEIAQGAVASRGGATGIGAGAGAPRAAGGGAPTKRAVGPGLEVVDAGQTALAPGRRFPLLDTLSIGRSASNDIALEDDWVSAQHLRLRRRDGAWIAEDMGSTNGTRVNGRPLKGTARVKPGDVLDLGRVKLRVVDKV